MTERIPRRVVHYGLHDASTSKGGVETHGRNLALAFDEVVFMSRATRDESLVRRERLPVICDNQMVLDWPADIPVIGIQHGVALYKSVWVPGFGNLRMALDQARAAKRPN